MANPDISTLWNICKEVLVTLVPFDHISEEHDKVLKNDLELSVQCLGDYPKSYGAWHHRRGVGVC
jgi:hypothetical protein